MLLQRRSLAKDSFPGCLDISSAGHIEHGYNFIETAKKELGEELGLTVASESLIELFTQTFREESSFRGKRFIDNEINKVYLLNSPVDIADVRLQPSEMSEVLWMLVAEIMEKLEEGDSEFCMNKNGFLRAISAIEAYYNSEK